MKKKPRRASDQEVNSLISKAPIENLVESFYNAFLGANIRARADAGIKEMVIREALGGGCPWCQKLAGIYEYGTEPKDIFKRHDNCTCIVTFRTEEGYTDVWTNEKFERERDARIARVEELEQRGELRKKYDRLHRIAQDEGRPFSVEADPDDFEFMSNSFRPKFGKTRDLTGNFGTDTLSPYRHELGHHLYQMLIQSIAKKNNLPYNVLDENSQAKEILDEIIADFVHEKNNQGKSIESRLSKYAQIGYRRNDYSEILAEAFSGRFNRMYAEELLEKIMEVMV